VGQKEEVDSRVGIILKGIIDGISSAFATTMPGIFATGIQNFSDVIVKGDITQWDKTVDMWVTSGYCDTDTGGAIKEWGRATGLVGLWMRTSIRIQMIQLLISSTLDVVGLDRQYDLMSKTTPNPAPADNLVRSMIIDPARATENRSQISVSVTATLRLTISS